MVVILITVICSCPILVTFALIFLHWKWILSSSASSEENEQQPIPNPKLFMTVFWAVSMVILAMAVGAVVLYIFEQMHEVEVEKMDGEVQQFFGDTETAGKSIRKIVEKNLSTTNFEGYLRDYLKNEFKFKDIDTKTVNVSNEMINFLRTTKFSNDTKICVKNGKNVTMSEETNGANYVNSMINTMKKLERNVNESKQLYGEMELSGLQGIAFEVGTNPSERIKMKWGAFEKVVAHIKNDATKMPEKLKIQQKRKKSESEGKNNQHLIFGSSIICTILCLFIAIWIVQHIRSKKPEKRHPLIIYWTLSMFYVSSLVTIIFSLCFIVLSFDVINLNDCRVGGNSMSYTEMTSAFEVKGIEHIFATTLEKDHHRICANKSTTIFEMFSVKNMLFSRDARIYDETQHAMKIKIVSPHFLDNMNELENHVEKLRNYIKCAKTSVFSNFIEIPENYTVELSNYIMFMQSSFTEDFMPYDGAVKELDEEIKKTYENAEAITAKFNITCSKMHQIFTGPLENVCDLANFQLENITLYMIFVSFSSLFPTILLIFTHLWMNSEKFDENVTKKE